MEAQKKHLQKQAFVHEKKLLGKVEVARHLAKQNTAFRGHDETNDSASRGNFLEELYFLAKYDKPLKRWIESHPQNLSYLLVFRMK